MNSACRINAILAIAEDGAIGRENKLPWRLRSDLQLFKAVTKDAPMIMGSKTFDSLPGILPGRPHLVLSSRQRTDDHAIFFDSFDDVLEYVRNSYEQAFVIGGRYLYEHFFAEDLVDRAYVTRVHASVPDADVRFPLDELLARRTWTESNRVPFQAGAHNEHAFTFTVLDRTR